MTIDLTSRYTQSPIVHAGKRWAVHYTATPTPSASLSQQEEITLLDAIDRYHREMRRFEVGVGYHVLIFTSGRSYRVGRQGTQRAHVLDRNHEFDGLCFMGTFTAEKPPSDLALDEGLRVIRASGMPVAGGHRDLMPPGYTECPGGWRLTRLADRVLPEEVSQPLTIGDRAMLFRWLTNERLAPGVRLVPKPKRGTRRVYEVELP